MSGTETAIVPSCNLAARLRTGAVGAGSPASRIRRSKRLRLVHTPRRRRRTDTLRWPSAGTRHTLRSGCRSVRHLKKRRWGYFIWVVAGLVIGVPEIAAFFTHRALHIITISETVGHLERHHTWFELLVIAGIVLPVYSIVRVRPHATTGEGKPRRTPGGRLTIAAAAAAAAERTEEGAPRIFAFAAAFVLAGIGFGTWAASEWWDDQRHFHPSLVLYTSLFAFWVAAPSVVAFLLHKDAPFPTLFKSIGNLEEWLASRTWRLGRRDVGPILAWLVGYVILAGLVILLLHLTLYPFPDITHTINPGG